MSTIEELFKKQSEAAGALLLAMHEAQRILTSPGDDLQSAIFEAGKAWQKLDDAAQKGRALLQKCHKEAEDLQKEKF